MRGTLIKRGTMWSFVVELGRDNKGKRKQKWYSGFKTKKEAEKKLAEVIHQIETNTFINPDKLTLEEYLKQWLSDYVEPNLTPSTIAGYKVNIEKHIIPSIGNIPLQKLQPAHVQKFYNEKIRNGRLDGKGGLSAKSVMYIHRNLREALSYAVKQQLIMRNVADMVELPKQKKFQATFLNEEEVQELLEAFKGTYCYVPVLLGVGLGLRRGEALGLQWKDIDFDNKTIQIRRSLIPTKDGLLFHDPKTEGSKRIIVAPETIINELKAVKEKQDKDKEVMGEAYNDMDLVTCYGDGSPINPTAFGHSFIRTLAKNKLKHIRFHDLRHTNATLMLKQNIPAKVASERLGHSTIGITLDLYSHVLKEMQEEAASKIEEIIFKK
ncbi:MAG: Transposase [Firmicutes bacterium ADurb.Bin146]|nr:MAG: Transposase [Firmicutes bacterium ADurb.Bin146]